MELPPLFPDRKIIFIVIDGLGDRRTEKPTPLEAADTPVMDRMAFYGVCGLHYPLRPGLPVGSGLSHMKLLGVSNYPGRGVLEALGSGIEISPHETAYRVNFATLDSDYVVLDRRAGRSDLYIEEMLEDINSILAEKGARLYHTEGHRGVLVVEGDPVPDMDPQVEGRGVLFHPGDTEDERRMNWIVMKVHEVLLKHPLNAKRRKEGVPPVTGILPRGGGKYVEPDIRYPLEGVGIADRSLYLGAARYRGFRVLKVPDSEKIEEALRAREKFVFVHFKMADVYGHDGKWKEKRDYLSFVDTLLRPLLEEDVVVSITGDHSTPVSLKNHSGDPVPLLVYGGERDDTTRFTEYECVKGRIGVIKGENVLEVVLNQAGWLGEVGK